MRSNSKTLLIFAGVALLATLGIIWQLIVYAQAAPQATQFPIVVAIIALIGTLWTGAITFSGLLMKESIDRRNTLLQEASEQRNAVLQAEAEKRLRMEAAIKAIELMSMAEAEGVPAREGREGAIFVMASLGHLRLALTMAAQFWHSRKISTNGMVQIVDQCLKADDDHLKDDAALALRRYHKKLAVARDCLEFPDSAFLTWKSGLPSQAKGELLTALLRAFLSKKPKFWLSNVPTEVLYSLYKMFTIDTEGRFRFACAMCAKELHDVIAPESGASFMPPDQSKITYQEILDAATKLMSDMGGPDGNIGVNDYDMALEIRAWKAQELEFKNESAE